jgi:hypothetical protein
MVYSGTIVAVAEMQFFAGENVDATGDVEANHNYLAGYAEAFLSTLVKYDIVTNWGSLNAVYKILFSEWAARFAANELIKYNMSGYTSRIEAEDLINVNAWRMMEIQKILEKAEFRDFLGV